MDNGQLLQDGQVIEVDGNVLECTAVSYTEVEGRRYNYYYTLRRKSEVDAEREAAAKAEEERQALEATEAATQPDAETPEPATQPEPIKEETLNVK